MKQKELAQGPHVLLYCNLLSHALMDCEKEDTEKEEMGKGGAKEGSLMNSFEKFHNLMPNCQVYFLYPCHLFAL